jgi:hypothetical protein
VFKSFCGAISEPGIGRVYLIAARPFSLCGHFGVALAFGWLVK